MRFYKTIRALDALYLLLLGMGAGCIMTLAMAASTIFKASAFLPQLSISDSGLLMGEIFVKSSMFFYVLAIVIILYELLTFFSAQAFTRSNQRRLWLLVGGINVIMIFLFTLYYMPYIMEAQSLGTVGTEEFNAMHKQSELVFKILFFTLILSILWRAIVGSTPRSK
ncbi:DUF4149 domain-containing protein [Helicobacter jaachi]|uniref:DUF4149 domain-containing protein n=1 Tax=Helicobacter jaachi TaxID=1677920 RepID=A0A4U8T8J7_9HELI|nr:DUF4149 domain-containing protein [Helicobacter jaachi]TLD96020.1 DUF4149 domain-containing protein [Helicobacter jaachi]